jgi:hypothetical protein
VFSAWLNHVDTKSINSMDTLITENGRSYVRHNLLDFGSTMGSAALKPREYDEGYEYIYDPGPLWRSLVTFGFYPRNYLYVPYEEHPSLGRFDGEHFDPEAWKPRFPNAAFRRARPDDTFWAARKLQAISDDMIRAAVRSARYSDPAAEAQLAATIIARRDRAIAAHLTAVNPVVSPALDGTGTLSFENAAVEAGLAKAPEGYVAAWHAFDNATGTSTPLGAPVRSAGTRLPAPAALPQENGAFVQIDISATNPPHESWATPVRTWFKREAGIWRLIGLERVPDGAPLATPRRTTTNSQGQG